MKRVFGNIESLAHEFYYKEHNEECRTRSAWFMGNRFGSYGTCIGYIFTDKNGRKTLLASDSYMSATTAKHLNALKYACPFGIISVPFHYGDSFYAYRTQKDVLKRIAELFVVRLNSEMSAKRTYTRKPDRDYALELLKNMNDFVRITGQKIKGLAKYNKYLSVALSAENIKKASARVREQAKKQAEKTKQLVEKFKRDVAKKPMLDLIKKYAFDFRYSKSTKAELKAQELFNKMFDTDFYNPSFVIADKENGVVKTSQNITMPISDVLPLLKMWKHKHNIVGLVLGKYTILANNDKYVKIGCHAIPIQNVQALADVLL